MPDRALETVARGLVFPSSLSFTDSGECIVGESGVPFSQDAPEGAVKKINAGGTVDVLAEGLGRPLNGATWHEGSVYVSSGDDPGRIVRIDADGSQTVIVDNLPGPGNYHVNMCAFGPDGKLYFSQGAMTNMGIIGLDAYELGWLKRLPHASDVPGLDCVLNDVSTETEDPFATPGQTTRTGGFANFGEVHPAGTRIPAALPCTSAVMRCNPDGSNLELVAWGLRNAYGLRFTRGGELLATDQGSDDRGSRPIADVPDMLFRVETGRWYGWPDFIGGEPVTDPKYKPLRGMPLSFMLANHDELPPPERALVRFETHTGAVGFDEAPDSVGKYAGHLFVALFGDERPMTAPEGPQAGRCIVRVDPSDWSAHDYPLDDLIRPIDMGFHPETGDLYILDFGAFEMDAAQGVVATPGTGRLLRLPAGSI